MTLLVRPEAKHDIRGAAAWYEERQSRLGEQFITAIDQALNRIADKPDLYSRRYKELRRALVHRFPYAVYFVEKGRDTVVFAVLHQRQDFKVLDDRMKA